MKKMKIKLKDGTQVDDPRLNRLEEFDEKSRLYSIEDIRKEGVELKSQLWDCDEWFNQGNEGACVGFALGHHLAAEPDEVDGLSDRFLREKIYWEAQKIDRWPGGEYPGGDPFNSGTSVLAGVKIVKALNLIKEYRWAFGLEALLYGVGYSGPAVIGIPWYNDMYKPDANGFVKPTGNNVGGHAILVSGINIEEGYATLRNSWGKGWGKDGDCYITFEDLEKILNVRGECCFLIKSDSDVPLPDFEDLKKPRFPFHNILVKIFSLWGLGPKIAVFLGNIFRFLIGHDKKTK